MVPKAGIEPANSTLKKAPSFPTHMHPHGATKVSRDARISILRVTDEL